MIGRKGSGRSAAPVSRKWGLPAIDGARVAQLMGFRSPSTGKARGASLLSARFPRFEPPLICSLRSS
jgi:hypothetical protein